MFCPDGETCRSYGAGSARTRIATSRTTARSILLRRPRDHGERSRRAAHRAGARGAQRPFATGPNVPGPSKKAASSPTKRSKIKSIPATTLMIKQPCARGAGLWPDFGGRVFFYLPVGHRRQGGEHGAQVGSRHLLDALTYSRSYHGLILAPRRSIPSVNIASASGVSFNFTRLRLHLLGPGEGACFEHPVSRTFIIFLSNRNHSTEVGSNSAATSAWPRSATSKCAPPGNCARKAPAAALAVSAFSLSTASTQRNFVASCEHSPTFKPSSLPRCRRLRHPPGEGLILYSDGLANFVPLIPLFLTIEQRLATLRRIFTKPRCRSLAPMLRVS